MKERLLHDEQFTNDHKDQLTFQSVPYRQTSIQGQCLLQKIQCIKVNVKRYVIFILTSILTFGVILLPCYWYVSLRRWCIYQFCRLQQSSHFYITNNDGTNSIVLKQVGRMVINQVQSKQTIYFKNRYLKYFYKEEQNQRFFSAISYDYLQKIQNIYNLEKAQEQHKVFKGLSNSQVELLRQTYGIGAMLLPTPPCYILFLQQIVQPFFIFVIYSVLLWWYQEYYYYAYVIAITSIISISINLWDLISLNNKIFDMAFYETQLNVLRGSQVIKLSSKDLVPGDLVFVKDQIKLPFDGILLTGSLLMNECALTGESIPIVKKSLNKSQFMMTKNIDKNCCLYQGTQIVQICSQSGLFPNTSNINYNKYLKYGLLVCVTKTNFITLKGQLVRIITFPKSREMKFYKESAKFLAFLFSLSVISYVILAMRLKDHIPYGQLFVKFLDLITITVPPGLPASMSIGIAYSIKRLKQLGIYCISPDKIMIGGRIDFICFDKTGTLTEDQMDFYEFIPSIKSQFIESIGVDQHSIVQKSELMKHEQFKHLLLNMVTCHTIIKLNQTQKLVGDPMEIKVFEYSQFSILSRKESYIEDRYSNQLIQQEDYHSIKFYNKSFNLEGYIQRKFQFDSQLQRMSVLVKLIHQQTSMGFAYCKGSPESLEKIMIKQTIPNDYFQVLKKYASCGFRILALCYKQIDLQTVQTILRQEVQKQLRFIGFQVFENKLKPQTQPTIKILRQDAGMEMAIITGDNPLTASNIGFKSSIIQPQTNVMICQSSGPSKIKVSNFYQMYSPKLHHLQQYSNQNQIQLDTINVQKIKQKEDFECKNQELISHICSLGTDLFIKFCVTGQVFQRIVEQRSLVPDSQTQNFIEYIKIFARSKPNDKTQIISYFQSRGKCVGMCGDGANDCGALKQADVGLSLSNSEASIAAPFTSKVSNISSVINLIKECRGGLATNFSLFNIMALYSLIQYTSTILIQYFYAYPSDFQFLYWDLACNFLFFLTIGNTQTSQKISKQRPSDSLFKISNILYVLIMFGIQLLGQISAVLLMRNPPFSNYINYWEIGGQQNNLRAFQQLQTLTKVSIEGTTVFLFSNFMYLSTVLAFCISAPWKKQFYTNTRFLVTYIIIFLYSAGICVIEKLRFPGLQLVSLDIRFQSTLLLIAVWVGVKMYLKQKYIFQKIVKKLHQKFPHWNWL